MYDELKNKPELRKSITHITLSITVLTIIAVIIRLFTKNPPESWVAPLILLEQFRLYIIWEYSIQNLHT